MVEFVMPSLGADMRAGTLVAWRPQVGDHVRRGDIIAEVETEKGVIEVEVFVDGVVERFLVEPGAKVPVGTPLAILRSEGEEAGAPAGRASAPAEAPELPARAPKAAEAPRPQAPRPPEAAPIGGAPTVAYVGGEPPDLSRRQTPSARRRARELGLEISSVRAADARGPVTRDDVERQRFPQLAEKPAHAAREEAPRRAISPAARRRAVALGVELESVTAGEADGVVHLRDVERAAAARPIAPAEAPEDARTAMRRVIAAAMSRSKREIPHYYLSHTVDLGPAMDFLRAENERRPVGERLLPAVLLLKATALALHEVPELNAHFTGAGAPPLSRVHLGVAISLRGGGLVAPAIHDADGMSLAELMRAFKDLVARTRAGTLRGSELTDPTATVTNLGDRGVETVFPIIHPPQVAMVGFGRIVERPWVVDGVVIPRPVVTTTLAADHRVSDGHLGGRFLTALERWLGRPEAL